MDLSFTEEQKMLRDSTRAFLEKNCPTSFVRQMEEDHLGYSPDLWRQTAELGWQALTIPEAYGGMGSGFLELGILFEEIGRAMYPSPLFTTMAFGAWPILDSGTEEQKESFLPRIASGELVMTMALTETTGSWDPSGVELTARATQGGFILDGNKLFVENAQAADYIPVVARTSRASAENEGITVFIVDSTSPGISLSALDTVASDKQYEMSFKDVHVDSHSLLGKVDEGWPIVDRAIVRASALQAAEMAGGARKIFEMAVEYAKNRVQFGRPIGSFQVLQHYLANTLVNVDAAQLLAFEALWTLDQAQPAERIAAAANAWCSEAYRNATTVSNQIHGGIAYLTEFDHQLWLRRAKGLELKLGHARVHLDRFARTSGF